MCIMYMCSNIVVLWACARTNTRTSIIVYMRVLYTWLCLSNSYVYNTCTICIHVYVCMCGVIYALCAYCCEVCRMGMYFRYL